MLNGIPNLAPVDPGIWRGGQPTDEGWNWLKSKGITRIIKLNLESEGAEVAAEALGMEVIYKPIDLAEQIIFRPRYEDVQAAVNAIQPNTFVHCEHGQDRTGLIIGCYRVWKQAWEKERAWDEMIQNGFHVELLGLDLFWEWAV